MLFLPIGVTIDSLRLGSHDIARPDELLVPAYAAAASAGLLCLTVLYALATRSNDTKDATSEEDVTNENADPSLNGEAQLKRSSLASVLGGKAAVAWKTVRALCVFALFGMAIADLARSNIEAYKALVATYVILFRYPISLNM